MKEGTPMKQARIRAAYLEKLRQAQKHKRAMREEQGEKPFRYDWEKAFCDARQASLDLYEEGPL